MHGVTYLYVHTYLDACIIIGRYKPWPVREHARRQGLYCLGCLRVREFPSGNRGVRNTGRASADGLLLHLTPQLHDVSWRTAARGPCRARRSPRKRQAAARKRRRNPCRPRPSPSGERAASGRCA
eukprot:7199662-Pyramimonas_sp.AAC.2